MELARPPSRPFPLLALVLSTPSHPAPRALSRPQQAAQRVLVRQLHLELLALSRPRPAVLLASARPSHLAPEVLSRLSQAERPVLVRLLSQVLQASAAQVFLARRALEVLVFPVHQV